MESFLNYVLVGIANGCIYSLIAIGIVLIYKSSGIFNLAQGAIVILSGYVFYSISIKLNIPVVFSVLLSMSFGGLLGFAIQRVLLSRLIGQPILSIVILTLALEQFFKGIMYLVWGADVLSAPKLFPEGSVRVLSLAELDYSRISFILITFFLIGLFALFYNKTKTGLSMKATSDDTIAAAGVGINVNRALAIVWVISCITAATGGILVTNVMGIHYDVAEIGFKAIAVALVGGLESLPGIIIVGPLMGIIEFLASGYIDPLVGGGMRELAPFIILLAVLLIRPYGIFGWQRIERI